MQVIPTTGRAALTPFEDAFDRLELAVAAPTVIQKLLAVLADPKSGARDVQAVLTADVALVTRLLRLASSAAYARRPVRDLLAAIMTVGLHEVQKLAVTAHFARAEAPFLRELWSYALAVASTSERLGQLTSRRGAEPFLAGLLHDVGTLVMHKLLGARYGSLAIVPGDARQCALERAAFGFDHGDLGAMAVARWNLFPELELVAQLHHDPLIADRLALPADAVALVELVALARLGVLALPDGPIDEGEGDGALLAELARRRGITVDAVRAAAAEGRARAVATMGALGGGG
jgi:HD-like signal output (HDOD) protein